MRDHGRVPRHRELVPLRWSDTDAYGHINNVMIMRLLEEARVAALDDDLLVDAQPDRGTGLLVARQEIEYLVPLSYRSEPVPIDLWLTRIGASDFELGYEVHDGETVYARAETTLFSFDMAAQKPCRLTPQQREHLLAWADEPIRWRRRKTKTAAPR
jgi:acyl-CoA thioester hydrolase